jgi:hypothetical protein
LPIRFEQGSGNQLILADWVLLRKFVDPEPAHSTWGTEEGFSTETKTYNSDVVLQQLTINPYGIDVLLQQLGALKTYDVDILLSELGVSDYDADILLKKLNDEKTYDVDVLIKKIDEIITYLIDLKIREASVEETKDYLIDLLIKKILESPFSIDIVLLLSSIDQYNLDILLKAFGKSLTYRVDTSLKRLGDFVSYIVDNVLVKAAISPYAIDTMFERQQTSSYFIDVLLLSIYSFDWVIGRGYSRANFVQKPNFISELFGMDTNVWNKKVRQLTLTVRLTDLQKNEIQTKYMKRIFGITDGIYNYTVWLQDAAYARVDHKERQWIADLTFFVLWSDEPEN